MAEAKTPFHVFPKWRMDIGFPWIVWSVGWLAIFKAVIWLSTNPGIQDPEVALLAARLGVKSLVTMIPFIIVGIGVWNLRKWAVWGLIALCIADLLFFLVTPGSVKFVAGEGFIVLTIVLLLFNGPLGNILILLSTPALLKYAGKTNTYARETE